MPPYSIASLNALEQRSFISCLSGVYEHSPWVAEHASLRRPFASVGELAAAMHACVLAASEPQQLALIRAHPELAGKLAIDGGLTAASRLEQSAAGLDKCTPHEFARISGLNQAYQAKFGFPFIIAVRGMSGTAIIAAMEQRLAHPFDREICTALDEIGRIASFRLNDLVID
ncbi:2-oxo-4-hydroxy-4-carboxy-5-ureidoimidazoline decarboxylase [Sulfuriferula sp. GW1]|uniref:2-oxo-4-hydroxy-4-carboxy-5-ureidoimidazoline decarboxylase n=1 Tax=Sulfuriferula sp. GW1 TaxID=3345111 RepID=UPI0039B0B5CD